MYLERDVSDSRTGGAPFLSDGGQKVRVVFDMSDCPTNAGQQREERHVDVLNEHSAANSGKHERARDRSPGGIRRILEIDGARERLQTAARPCTGFHRVGQS